MKTDPIFMDRWHGKCLFEGGNTTYIDLAIMHNFCQNYFLFNLYCIFSINYCQNFVGFAEEIDKLNLKLIWKCKGPTIAISIWKKNNTFLISKHKKYT